MTNSTYEQYDENEYFLKYLTIHPILIYSNNEYDKNKKKYQEYLLNLFNKEIINYEILKQKYDYLVNIEIQNKILYEHIKEKHRNIENDIVNNNNKNLINLCNTLIKQ
jgi:hypothetical protein